MCIDALGQTLQQTRVTYVVEADIKAFFDTVNHEWMIKFLRHRIGDERVIRLIGTFPKWGSRGFVSDSGQHPSPRCACLSSLWLSLSVVTLLSG